MILDLTLPDIDGLDVCRAVRAKSDVPILMRPWSCISLTNSTSSIVPASDGGSLTASPMSSLTANRCDSCA